MSEKFLKQEKKVFVNPVDWYNENTTWSKVLPDSFIETKDNTFAYDSKGKHKNHDGTIAIFKIVKNKLEVIAENPLGFPVGDSYTKFETFTRLKCSDNWRKACNLIEVKQMNRDIPFIRVATDFFKIVEVVTPLGAVTKVPKAWKKDTLIDDYGKGIIAVVPRYDDFCMKPNNLDYQPVVDNRYNKYAPFAHLPHNGEVGPEDIPASMEIMKRVFGSQIEAGWKYMQALYMEPTLHLPVVVLISKERGTGKSTYLNWLSMIFGANYNNVSPDTLKDNHNEGYAYCNIIGVDEASVEKSTTIEKVKNLSTAKEVTVNPKFVNKYTLPLYLKIVFCTNREKDFMRIDQEEVRFFVRKLKPIPKNELNTRIEDKLRDEIPKFLRYLLQLPKLDISKYRSILTPDEIENIYVRDIKNESHSWLYKEIQINIEEFFNEHQEYEVLEITLKELMDHIFANQKNGGSITKSYLKKVLTEEFNKEISAPKTYYPVNLNDGSKYPSKTGRVFMFRQSDFDIQAKELTMDEVEEQIPF